MRIILCVRPNLRGYVNKDTWCKINTINITLQKYHQFVPQSTENVDCNKLKTNDIKSE